MDTEMLEVIDDEDFNTSFRLGVSSGHRADDGVWVDGRDWLDLRAVIQPAKGYKTQHLSEGDRHKPAIHVWCGRELNPTYDGVAKKGDLIEWHGKNYQVVEPMDWSQYGYWQALAIQVIRNE